MIEYHQERWSDMQYDKEFKLQALELSDEIGVKAAYRRHLEQPLAEAA